MAKIVSLVFIVGVLMAPLAAQPAGELNREKQKLAETVELALDVIYDDCCKDLPKDEQKSRVRQIVSNNYDLDVVIRRAIGRNWRLMNSSEQQKVLELVTQLIMKAYVQGMEGSNRPDVTYGEVVSISDKRIEIPSNFFLDGQNYSIIYRLGRLPNGWQIYDIVAENISIVSNYRQQIDDHFRKGNAAELIDRLEELSKKDNIDEHFTK